VGHHQFGVVLVHRHRAGHDGLPRQIARLLQNVVEAQPVHGKDRRIGPLRRLARRARFRLAARAKIVPSLAPINPEPRMPMRMAPVETRW